jgi:hypothetical protein
MEVINETWKWNEMSPEDRYRWMHHHSQTGVTETLAFGTGMIRRSDDMLLIRRALRSFRSSDPERFYPPDSQWRWIFEQKQGQLMQTLLTGSEEEVASILHNPHQNYLCYGFEDLSCDSYQAYQNSGLRAAYAARCQDLLVRLAEGLGVLSVENPEGGSWGQNMMLPVRDLVSAIERSCGAVLPLPDFHPGYAGLEVGNSFLTDRVLNAYYCAHRVRQLAGGSARLLEIGGGMGYVAYFSILMGCSAFTIVDLPLTGLCQAYFLMRALGPERVVLAGEETGQGTASVHLLSPDALDGIKPVDFAVNMDGLTEYGRETATSYMSAIRARAPRFLSINHEANPYRVRDLILSLGDVQSYERFPSWLRGGYVEEIVVF